MKNLNTVFSILLASTLFLGCKPKNPDMYGVAQPVTPPTPQDTKYTGPRQIEGKKPVQEDIPQGTKVDIPPPPAPPPEPARYKQEDKEIFKPKVDIIFMQDPSDSMKDDHTNLRNNIKSFSNNFLNKRQFLDFHVGVVTAWDSISFEGLNKDCTLGQLRPLGGINGKFKGSCNAAKDEIPYITNETATNVDTLNKILGTTVSFGVESFKRDSKTKLVLPQSGPQHEEIFSPVIAALRPESQQMNKNFRRADAHLAVVFFTDTDDFDYINIDKDALMQDDLTKKTLQTEAAKLSISKRESLEVLPTEIASFLKSQEKENVTVSVYAALGRYNDWINTNGKTQGVYKHADYYIQQPGRGPRKMVELLDLMNGIGFDLRDPNYGSELSKIGNDIVMKSLRRTIVLDYPPEIGNAKRPIIVKYGQNQEIKKDDKTGWSYKVEADSSGNQIHKIIISENIGIQPEAGAKFSVEYTPVSKTNVQ
ncbi:hypothetical protein K2X05_09875 [bacterium]|nr:hypothetical protein [bacterium]